MSTVNKDHKLSIGDKVVVNKCVSDPDFGSDLSGWSGIINSFDTTAEPQRLVEIYWDKTTLSRMPKKYVRKCEKSNLNHEIMWLYESEVDFMISEEKDIQNNSLINKILSIFSK